MKPSQFSLTRFWLLTCLTICLLGISTTTFAKVGSQFQSRGDDLVVKSDSRWIGTTQGGYHPVRMSIRNTGPSRLLTVQFSQLNNYQAVPTVRRSIQVDQNETARFTLLIPVVSGGNYGHVQFFHDGKELKRHKAALGLANSDSSAANYPSLLVISPKKVDLTKYELAIKNISSVMTSTSGGWHPHSSVSPEDQYLVLEPSLLPESWLAYSGVDIVSVPLSTLNGMARDARSAILKWVETGGTLVVYNVGEKPEKSSLLADVLEQKTHNHSSSEWEVTKGDNRIATRAYLQGEIYSVKNSISDEISFSSTTDWEMLLNKIGKRRYSWSDRHGVSPRSRDSEFLKFSIPGVSGVPVYSFLFLITIFAVVIGPLNYFFFWKRKQLYLLLFTIPVIAVVTSLSLFGYSLVAHGWGVKSRIRSVTVLHQPSNTAVSTARVALFAGMTPSDGLQFSPETAVYPIWKSNGEFKNGTVNWSDSQSFASGWLRSRTNTQFLLKEHRTERGRLNIRNRTDGKLDIVNGLEWDITEVIVIDEEGNVFKGNELAAGASTKLNSTKNVNSFVKLTKQFPLQFPDGVTEYDSFESRRGYRSYHWEEEPDTPIQFNTSLSERAIYSLSVLNKKLKSSGSLPNENRKTYYAILKQNPGIGIGIEGTDERAGYHLLIGYY